MGEATGQEMTKYEKNKNTKRILGNITNNLGIIEITGGQIICHINNKKLDKYLKENNNTLTLKGFVESDKLRLEALYGIGKTIKYVIEDYRFNDVFLDTIGDTTLQFNNCLFEGYDLNVGNVRSVIFNNSKFYIDNELNIFNNNDKQIENVKLIDCSFINEWFVPGARKIFIASNYVYINGGEICSAEGVYIKTNEIKLSDATINTKESLGKSYVCIFSDKYVMTNSLIDGGDLKIVCPSMQVRNSTFDNESTEIYNKNCNIGEFDNKSGNFKYNDITLLPYRRYHITPESYELLKERERLANVLYKLNDKCDKEVKKKVRILKNKSVSETLGE